MNPPRTPYSAAVPRADNGRPAAEGERFGRESTLILADVDFERLEAARLSKAPSMTANPFPLPEMPFI